MMMRQGVRALHSCLLQRLRVVRVQSDLDGALAMMPWRGGGRRRMFSAEVYAPGTYLDRRDVVERVLNVVKTNPKVDPAKVSESANFGKDLELDFLDTVELVMAFEEEFALEIPNAEADKLSSCAAAIDYIASHPRAK
jgi:NADH dehydrogenase (ubiquinone) 1 alpha/beta subcomplex 1